jgi:hypothetical protein
MLLGLDRGGILCRGCSSHDCTGKRIRRNKSNLASAIIIRMGDPGPLTDCLSSAHSALSTEILPVMAG